MKQLDLDACMDIDWDFPGGSCSAGQKTQV